MVGVPTPAYQSSKGGVVVRHNHDGFRGDEILARNPSRLRIIAVGGSTTYGTQVSNEETWPFKLGQLLGDRYEVLNFGIPGHSSAEHIVLTALRLSDYKPDIIVFYMGWNDLRSAHLTDLRSDFANFHMLEQFSTLAVEQRYRADSALLYLMKWLLVRAHQLDEPKDLRKDSRGTVSTDVDPRLEAVFERNITILASTSHAIGAVPVFVPQVLNSHFSASDYTTWWVPFVPVSAVPAANDHLGGVMRARVRVLGERLIDAPVARTWQSADFIDQGHFTPLGHEKLATVIAEQLRDHGR